MAQDLVRKERLATKIGEDLGKVTFGLTFSHSSAIFPKFMPWLPNINILLSSALLWGASFLLLQRAEGPFGPTGDSGRRTNKQTNGMTMGLRELDNKIFEISKENIHAVC